jgi:spermidine synthase
MFGSLFILFGMAYGIFFYCMLLGYMTPFIIDHFSLGSASRAGKLYAVNIIGCVLGPLVSGYILLPLFGIKWSFISLSIPFVLLFTVSFFPGFSTAMGRREWGVGLAGVLGIIASFVFVETYEDSAIKAQAEVRRDYTATVISTGSGFEKQLLVNGVGMTNLTPIAKMMAHMPAGFLQVPPENALIICFGMGTTFRSFLSWNIDVTAVELIPSVRDAVSYYHPDAESFLKNPKGEIVIDDGRRYLKRTNKRFDVITIDPPPPVEASASSLLYSIEFYTLIKSRLTEHGILHQWLPGGEKNIQEAVARSLVLSFPHVRIFTSIEGWGWHFLASMHSIEVPRAEAFIARMPEAARTDFMEWFPDREMQDVVSILLSQEEPLERMLNADVNVRILDDKPFNEYYFLRRCHLM